MQTTGKSGKEECLLSQQDDEKSRETSNRNKSGAIWQIQRLPKFLKEVRQETKSVDRPGWREVRSTTVIVVGFVLLLVLYLHTLDWILSALDRWLFIN
jgi:preprotein translocase SecE subunit